MKIGINLKKEQKIVDTNIVNTFYEENNDGEIRDVNIDDDLLPIENPLTTVLKYDKKNNKVVIDEEKTNEAILRQKEADNRRVLSENSIKNEDTVNIMNILINNIEWEGLSESDETIVNNIKNKLNNIESIKSSQKDEWLPNKQYSIGDYVVYLSNVYKVVNSHVSSPTWLPSETPALYSYQYGENINVENGDVPNFVQPTGGHDAYQKGDLIKFNENTYESLINNNVWSPSNYPTGWVIK